jgi:predicted nucleic acid-binding protein
MRLIIDTNILVGELTRQRREELLGHPDLDLYMTPTQWAETRYEVPRRYARIATNTRVANQRITPDRVEQFVADAFTFITPLIQVVTDDELFLSEEEGLPARRVLISDWMQQATRRIADIDDAPTVALHLATRWPIWTDDTHFLGIGLAVWSTDRLILHLGLPARRKR